MHSVVTDIQPGIIFDQLWNDEAATAIKELGGLL